MNEQLESLMRFVEERAAKTRSDLDDYQELDNPTEDDLCHVQALTLKLVFCGEIKAKYLEIKEKSSKPDHE